MGPIYIDLNDLTRSFMLQEFDLDVEAGGPYTGKTLSANGVQAYPELLRETLASHDPQWLESQLSADGLMNRMQGSRRVSVDAAKKLSEGEFGRYYARGVCRRALEAGPDADVEVYRARHSNSPRLSSQFIEGQTLKASEVLESNRLSRTDPTQGIPAVNSGLSVRLLTPEVTDEHGVGVALGLTRGDELESARRSSCGRPIS